jgi:hypothetical protein
LQKEAQDRRLAQEFAQRYPGVDYTSTLKKKIKQVQNEIARIQQSLPTGQLQQPLP